MPNRRNFLRSAVAAPLLASTAAAEPQTAAQPAMPRPGDPAYWNKIRDQFLLARDKVFFNNGTIGAMPRMVLDRTVDHLRKMATDIADWDYRGPEWIAGYGPFEDIRSKTAKLLNCEIKEVALTEEFTLEERERAGEAARAAGISLKEAEETEAERRAKEFPANVDYIYEQPPEELFRALLPKYVSIQIFRALMESVAAEHAARMTAMDSATNNATDMIDSLTLAMNRARQAKITKEIIEIVSGAAAM